MPKATIKDWQNANAELREQNERLAQKYQEARDRAVLSERELQAARLTIQATSRYQGLYEGFREASAQFSRTPEEKRYEIDQRIKIENPPVHCAVHGPFAHNRNY